jgi:hypothetical protein
MPMAKRPSPPKSPRFLVCSSDRALTDAKNPFTKRVIWDKQIAVHHSVKKPNGELAEFREYPCITVKTDAGLVKCGARDVFVVFDAVRAGSRGVIFWL